MTEEEDLLAGEYVLGSLEPAERETAAVRRLTDPTFDTAVIDWENRLGAIEEATPSIEAPRGLWPLILARVRAEGPERSSATVIRLESGLRTWKRTAQVAMAIAAMLALWVAASPILLPRSGDATLVAVLEPADHQPAFLVRADVSSRELAISPLSSEPPAGKAFELWMIDASLAAPKSLGVLHGGDALHPKVSGIASDVLTRATYAVTVESAGGSPTGAPTGAPVYTGHLLRTSF